MITISCKSTKEAMTTTTPLFGTKWSLKKIYDSSKIEDVNTKAFIRFDKEKGSAGGNGSCNSFGSNATINGNEVSFKNIFSTKMYCEQVQQIENNYFNKLEKANRFEIKEKTLVLYNEKQKLLEFTTE
jgi:heat shock protein HslJ